MSGITTGITGITVEDSEIITTMPATMISPFFTMSTPTYSAVDSLANVHAQLMIEGNSI